jgi:transcriptional regulator with XRE-family HTH domain
MTVTLEEFTKNFSPEERAKVAARTAELVEEELTLRDLRQAQHLTQERMAELMGVEQENVSRPGTAGRPSALYLEQLCRRDGRQAAAGRRVSEPSSGRYRARRHHRQSSAQGTPAQSKGTGTRRSPGDRLRKKDDAVLPSPWERRCEASRPLPVSIPSRLRA